MMKKLITLFLLIFFAMGNLPAQRELQLTGTITGTHRHPDRIRITQGRIIPVSNLNIGSSFIPPTLSLFWYRDADGDGYGNPTIFLSTYQSGYVRNAGDCDDTDVQINPNTVWAIDRDGDGYGDPQDQRIQCERPKGYVKYKAGRVKQDFGRIIQQPQEFCRYVEDPRYIFQYEQSQDHAFGGRRNYSEENYYPIRREWHYTTICHSIPRTDPLDLVINQTDCNDQDDSVYEVTDWYQDSDGDGFGSSYHSIKRCRQPNGYVKNNQDCNDRDSNITDGTIWYYDSDGDGFGGP